METNSEIQKILAHHQSHWDWRSFALIKEQINVELNRMFAGGSLGSAMHMITCLLENSSNINGRILAVCIATQTIEILHSAPEGQREIPKLIRLCKLLLNSMSFDDGNRVVKELSRDFYRVLGEQASRSGDLLRSEWQREMARYLTRRTDTGPNFTDLISEAKLMLRSGATVRTKQLLDQASDLDLSADERFAVGALSAKCKRLSGLRPSFDSEIDPNTLSPETRLACVWESQFSDRMNPPDLKNLLHSFKKAGLLVYLQAVVRVHLFAKALGTAELPYQFPSLTYKKRRLSAQSSACRVELRIAETFDYFCDRSYRPFVGLRLIERQIGMIDMLEDIELQMICLAGFTRALSRKRLFSFAAITLRQYIALSQKMAGREICDVLGYCRSMMNSDWLKQSLGSQAVAFETPTLDRVS